MIARRIDELGQRDAGLEGVERVGLAVRVQVDHAEVL